MRYVIDSSVAVKWVLPETDSDTVLRLLDGHQQGVHELLAPDWFLAEVANIFGKAAVKRSVLTVEQARQGYSDITSFGIELYPTVSLVSPALELALRHHRAVYDCLYVALAEREHCQLVTADQALVNQLASQHPFVISLAACPV